MRRVIWMPEGREDLRDIVTYIAADNHVAADRMAKRIRQTAKLLAEMPTVGRKGRVTGTYEKIVLGTPYILSFQHDDEKLYVLRVIHMSRDWPNEGWP